MQISFDVNTGATDEIPECEILFQMYFCLMHLNYWIIVLVIVKGEYLYF